MAAGPGPVSVEVDDLPEGASRWGRFLGGWSRTGTR